MPCGWNLTRPPGRRAGFGGQRLTPREREVVRALAGGLTSKHIARQLGISPRTVDKHRENSMRKLGVHDMGALLHGLRLTGYEQNDTTQSEVFSRPAAIGKVDTGR